MNNLVVQSDAYCPLFILGFVGELHPDKNSNNVKHVLYTHKNIIIKYNKDQVCFPPPDLQSS